MEAGIEQKTGSRTIADLLPRAANTFAKRTDGATSVEELRERGRARDRSELESRYAAVGSDDPFTFIYTSGTTGPPKGCVLSHGNYRAVLDMVEERDLFQEDDDNLVYLFL